MGRTLRVAALQLAAHDRAAFESGEIALRATVDAAARDHDLLVLPEGTLPAYVLGDANVDDAAITRAVDDLRAIARSRACTIVAGAAIRRDDVLYNSAIVIDADGSVAGSADKLFLWHFDRKWFAPGQAIAPVDTRAGRLGVMICADGRMPGIGRTLVDRGAELLVMPTAWVTSGRDPQMLENVQADLLARVRAYENGVPFVAANKCGVERTMVLYCGKSQIIDHEGNVVAVASQHEPQTVSATIELGLGTPKRESTPKLDRRDVPSGSSRVAFSLDAPPADIASRLDVLDASELITPSHDDVLDARVAFDPGVLPAYRAAGYRRIILDAAHDDPWLERIARARALELRIFVIVFDRERDRAYAVDPDGAVAAGTFGAFRIASVAMDYRRTSETMVAPGTDIERGLAYIATIAGEQARA